MKTYILFLLAATLGGVPVWGQRSLLKRTDADSIARVRLLAQYEARFVIDTTKADKPLSETMLLEIGTGGISKFYSQAKAVRDSSISADLGSGGSPVQVLSIDLRKYPKSRMSETLFRGYPDAGKVTTLDEVGLSHLRCTEADEAPRWTLLPDTTTLLVYHCRRAVATFKGRTWRVWYTPDVPVDAGPWKLHGLPGMIVAAEDADGHYSFRLCGLERMRVPRALHYEGGSYEPVSRKAYRQVHERYAADPVGFITEGPGVRMTVTDPQGNKLPSRRLAYNPIER
ncbi:MAG: GLPGLI family protein [Prevotellaceae bacterium]|jgi:GLPGLI family protein|nr:GLPGLI family protein [Prevotellaceae bacterium]